MVGFRKPGCQWKPGSFFGILLMGLTWDARAGYKTVIRLSARLGGSPVNVCTVVISWSGLGRENGRVVIWIRGESDRRRGMHYGCVKSVLIYDKKEKKGARTTCVKKPGGQKVRSSRSHFYNTRKKPAHRKSIAKKVLKLEEP